MKILEIIGIVIGSILGWVLLLATMKIVANLFVQSIVEILVPAVRGLIDYQTQQKKQMLENLGISDRPNLNLH